MKDFLKKLLLLISEQEEVQKELSLDEIESFLKDIKHKKIEYLNLKGFDLVETKNTDGSLRLVAIASTDSIDRGLDVVIPTGIKTTNIKNGMIPMLLQHEHEKIVGGWDKWYVKDNTFVVEGTFLAPVTDWQKDAYEKVKSKVLNGISIGFIIDKVSFDNDIRILDEIELLEVSVVTIPMNQDCFITEVQEQKSVSSETKSAPAEEIPATSESEVASPDPSESNPAHSEEQQVANELAKLKEENDALKQKVSQLETEVADYEAVMEELNKETEELLKSKGVKYEAQK